MWKRRRTWTTLALLILLNLLAWDIRTDPQAYAAYIQLHQHPVKNGVEYTALRPARFYFDSVWYSYAVALLVGFGLPFLLPRLLPWAWQKRHVLAYYIHKAAPHAAWLGRHSVNVFFAFLKVVLLLMMGLVGALRASGKLWVVVALLIVFNVLAWDWKKTREKDELLLVLQERQTETDAGFTRYIATHYYGIAPGISLPDRDTSIFASVLVGEVLPFLVLPSLVRRRRPLVIPQPPVVGAPR
ncbi:MAG: hypothetical protein BGP24_12010 [Lysobacterales bacterium 69-70]|nr:hypothetical protein [Xanthomonadaceae bacterium]ODU30932.1 MAG: hypothetical protein ABS97_21775 [Xanthomonadaceae bacterium SCN 69-320]ODV15594.1 MAG: hypothetical protein ABT27_22520 [Xanthomonadaceae bacterium SCN 69-25]OJY98518.1 MAG: hypothetical protein BGP24_12010 [Xanthomonadales bacterium 69-70]